MSPDAPPSHPHTISVTMQLLLLVSAAVVVAGGQAAGSTRRVCYYATWAYDYAGLGKFIPSDLDPHLCSHYIYSFVNIGPEGEVVLDDESFDIDQGGLSQFAALKEQNTNLTLMVSVGGWDAASVNFSIVSANETLREAFAANVVDFLIEYELDGCDLDWEYPSKRDYSTAADKKNFVLLCEALRKAFEPHGYILSAAVAPTQSSIDLSYDVTALDEILDFLNLMTYDLHGTWDGVTGANAPLYAQSSDAADTVLTVNASVTAWIANGASPSKLNIGLGLYGHAYTLADASNNGTGAAIVDAAYTSPYTGETSTWNYIEICSDIKNNTDAWTIVNYENSYVYGVRDTLWIGYDNEDTMYAKGAYAKEMGLGGIMTWSVNGDDFQGYCGEKHALTKAAIRGFTGA